MIPEKLLSPKGILIGIAVVLILAGLVVSLGKEKQKPAEQGQVGITKEQEQCAPLYGTGKQMYDVLTDNPQNPQILKVEVDPINVAMGETQEITVKVKDTGSATITNENSVIASIFTDNKNFVAALKLIKAEDEKENSSAHFITTWKGSWTQEDTICHTYTQKITAKNSKGEESYINMSFK